MPSREPRRMVLGNLDDGEDLEAQYNPTEVQIALEVFFNRAKIPGQSYEEQQYSNTGNPKISFDLSFDGLSAAPGTLSDVENFIFSLAMPPERPRSVSTGAPPLVLLSWPGWIMLTTRMPKFTQKSKRFSVDGPPTYQTYTIELEVNQTRRIGREQIRRSALRRSS